MSINKYYDLAKTKLYPICRSITGRGLEETLKIIKKEFKSMKFIVSNLGPKFLIGKFHQNGTLKMLMF